MGRKEMKPWFGPRIGTNVGYHSIIVTYNVMPVSWEGWVVTFVYFALQFAGAIGGGLWLVARGLSPFWVFLQLIGLHLIYLWIASRHYVTRAEMEPSVLPADMRDPKLNE